MLANMTDYVTTAEAAQISGYTEDYVRKLARLKRIDASMKGGAYWIDAASLQAYLEWVKGEGTQRFNWRRKERNQVSATP